MWIAGAQDEDPWEFFIALRKVFFHILSKVFHAFFARVELLANNPQE